MGGQGGYGAKTYDYTSADNQGGSGTGGGLYLDAGTVTLSNTTLSGNEALGGHGGGTRLQIVLPGIGGTASGGGLYVAGGNVTLTNVALSDNQDVAGNGGAQTAAFHHYGSNGVNNNAYGGGLYVAAGAVSLNNATLIHAPGVTVASDEAHNRGSCGFPAENGTEPLGTCIRARFKQV